MIHFHVAAGLALVGDFRDVVAVVVQNEKLAVQDVDVLEDARRGLIC